MSTASDRVSRVRVRRRLTLEDAAALHGHKGPFLVIGYRIGEYAVKLLSPRDEFDLSVTAYIPRKTPFLCMLDGLQCSTKCTLGKNNICCVDSNELKIVFKRKRDGRELVIALNEEIVEQALKSDDLEKCVKEVEEAEIDKLIKRVEFRR